jgi:hypothetical protein
MAYITYDDVYRTSGVPSSVIPIANVNTYIQEAENVVCRFKKNIYWNIEVNTQLATSGAASSITKSSATWTTNAYTDMYVWIYAGTGSEQMRKIVSNTATALTVDRAWDTNPDNTSYFRIFYVPLQFNPYIDEDYDGNDQNYYYLPYYPVNKVETLSIQSTSVTISTGIYLWKKTGRIQLQGGSEYGKFTSQPPQGVAITYWYGVPYLPYEIKRLCELYASMQIMSQQMGGTYNMPSSVTLPDMTVSVGQQYINIKSALETLRTEYNALLEKVVKIYPVFA